MSRRSWTQKLAFCTTAFFALLCAGSISAGARALAAPPPAPTPITAQPLNRAALPPRSQALMRAPAIAYPQTWDGMLAYSWKEARRYYRIQPAPTVASDATCRGDLGLELLARNTTIAISIRKYGDAVRFMSQFQDRSLCLTREGTRGVEYALASYLHHALTKLPPAQAQIAVQGVMNLGMLTFDSVQYTRRSWWLPSVYAHLAQLGQYMNTYPRADLGLWLYDSRRGIMVRDRDAYAIDRLITSMQRFDNFGRGTCPLLDFTRAGYLCRDAMGAAGGVTVGGVSSNNGTSMSGGLAGAPSVPGQQMASCMLQSTQMSGPRGQLACVNKAMAGFTMDPRTAWQQLLAEGNAQPGVRDKSCALGDEAQGDDGAAGGDTSGGKTNEPSAWETFKSAVSIAVNAVVSVFDHTPEPISTLSLAASPEGADAERGAGQMLQELNTRNNSGLLTDDEHGIEKYEEQRDQRVVTDPQANKGRPAGGDMPGGGGACGARSNAAARAQTLFQCFTGFDPGGASPANPGGGNTGIKTAGSSGSSGTRIGGSTSGGGSPLDPRVTHVDPSADPSFSGALTGPLACVVESGDLVRASLNDPQCARMQCAAGQECPCNRNQFVTEPHTITRPVTATPDCIDNNCGQPGVGGAPNPPPAPSSGGRPRP